MKSLIKVISSFESLKELSNLSFAFLAFKEEGPRSIAHHNMHFVAENPCDFLDRISIFYMIITGQGGAYHKGLYGPLPVDKHIDYLAYVYAFTAHDNSSNDARLKDNMYSLLVMFFPRKLASYLRSTFEILDLVLSHQLRGLIVINQLTEPFLREIKDQLIFANTYWKFLHYYNQNDF
ncbi:MAG: hypothetical protein ACFFC7_14810 [Candidatus Hermodarchaeota archaeon]